MFPDSLKIPSLRLLLPALTFFVTGLVHAEPVVPAFERFHGKDGALDTATAGRLLFNEIGCRNCHGGETGLPDRKGPNLANVTSRARADWLRKFLSDPQGTKPGTPMPDLLNEEEAEQVLHYLGTLKGKTKKLSLRPQVNAELGSAKFHEKGCVACHQPTPDFRPAAGLPEEGDYTYPSIPLPNLQEKYDIHSLAAFLADPLFLRPHGRMPDFKLDVEEAGDLAAHLLDFQDSNGKESPHLPAFSVDKEKAAAGEKLFQSRRCAACHDTPKIKAVELVGIRKAASGCLSGKIAGATPNFHLSDSQREALTVWLGAERTELTPGKQADLTLFALNCVACHQRGEVGGPDAARSTYFTGDESIGDTARFPPPLTGAGNKLQRDWLEAVLGGTARNVRPYVHTKMPHFGENVEGLAALLKKADEEKLPPLAEGDPAAGQKLLGVTGGANCITCHQWSGRASLGIQALDLSDLHKRYEPDWFRSYLLDPPGYRPGTLMPPLWPGGTSMIPDVLGGDTEKQIASIYAFATQEKGEPEGYPATNTGEFEVVPDGKPYVMRTFMEGVGSKAILAGFPQGIHLAYDGNAGRPALLWKGKFFDTYNTWFSRAAPFEHPLGKSVIAFPEAADEPIRFRGYRIGDGGVPEFLLTWKGEAIFESFHPSEGGMQRSINGPESALATFPVRHPDSAEVSEQKNAPEGQRIYLYQWK